MDWNNTTALAKLLSTTKTTTTTLAELSSAAKNTTTISQQPIDAEYSTTKLFFVFFLSFSILISNGLIVTAFVTSRRLKKKPSNFLITSQACSDILTCLVFIPVHLIERLNNHALRIEGYFVCYMIFLSLFNLLALCVDRYLALYRPFLHHRLTCIHRVLKQIALIWTTSCLIAVLPLFWKYTSARGVIDHVFLVIIWAVMCLMVIFMTIVYLLVTKKAKQLIRNTKLSLTSSSSSPSSSSYSNTNTRKKRAGTEDSLTRFNTEVLTRKELRVVHLFGLLLFLFVTTYLPLIYMNFCDVIERPSLIPRQMEEVSLFTLLLGSLINPIISMSLKKDFHQHLKFFFRHITLLKVQQSFRNFSIASTLKPMNDSIALIMETSFIDGPQISPQKRNSALIFE